MSILICDICGTSYSDSEDKCPTCGYARAFAETGPEEDRPHAVHEKVRGGRFSKKNVRKRLKQQMEADVKAEPVHEADTAAVMPVADPVSEKEPVQEPDENEKLPLIIPVDLPEGEEEAAPEADPVTEQPAEEMEKEKQQKVLAVYRRDVALNLVLFFSLVVFLLGAVYLVINYGIPYLKDFTWPSQAVVETTEPTEPSTEAQTEASTEAPTEAPTEATTEALTEPPTEPPTEPATPAPTEEPTKALLNVRLTLNYYDLTFGAATQTTQLKTAGIPLEDITWISDNPNVVIISDTGLITAVGGGRTTVRAIYGDQEVTVKINCRF